MQAGNELSQTDHEAEFLVSVANEFIVLKADKSIDSTPSSFVDAA